MVRILSAAQVLDSEVDVKRVLYVKDNFNISDLAYNALRNNLAPRALPPLPKIRTERKHIDNHFESKRRGQFGYHVDVRQKIEWTLNQIHQKKGGDIAKFKVKICADGTNIGRSLKILNLNFSVLNEGKRAKTAKGQLNVLSFLVDLIGL